MLEISIFCVILFAIAYWATLFIMGRREDVLHGEFVEAEPELVDAAMPHLLPCRSSRPNRSSSLRLRQCLRLWR
jgi:hypothetical protein